MPNLEPDFKDMLSALVSENVKFLVIGGHAVGFHGLPRYTRDIDFWVDPSPANLQLLWRALARFGAPMDRFPPSVLEKPDSFIQIGVEPVRIDFCNSLEGVNFGEAWANRAEVQDGELLIPVIGLDQLIRNKEAVGRDRDRADAKALRKIRDQQA